jgi:glycosyltransferase involved in cell wall biosynthesis
VRILLVSNMYPSRRRPEFGVFVANLADALRARGHTVDEAVLRSGRRGRLATPLAYLGLLLRALGLARRSRPDVVYAHYLVPSGLIGLACRRPVVATAHGGDVRNACRGGALGALSRLVVSRSAAVVCVSRYLAGQLPGSPGRLEVIDCGVDTTRFTPAERAPGQGPRFLYVGSLTGRKNVGRLLQAFERLGEGSLTVVGGGPLEGELRAAAPAGVRFTGRLPPQRVVEELRMCDVLCLPSLEEPLGQAALEALASGRPVVATRVGGPPEYVRADCGALVDPLDVGSIADGMRVAASLPVPCRAAVEVAREHDLARQAERVEQVMLDAWRPRS